MFRCQVSGQVSKPKEKLIRVPIETRTVTYEHRDEKGNVVKTTKGTEIVRELRVTEAGLRILEKRNALKASQSTPSQEKTFKSKSEQRRHEYLTKKYKDYSDA